MGLEVAFLCRPESGLPYFDPFITFLCFEIEEIRDHFSQPTWGVPRVKVVSDLLKYQNLESRLPYFKKLKYNKFSTAAKKTSNHDLSLLT